MSKAKINFEIEKEALANAKAYVARHGGSLNKLVGALFSQLGQRLNAPDIDPSKKILFDLSCGNISLMEATRLLGFKDAGYTLHLMAEEGLPMKRLSEETIKRQAAESLEAMRECLLPSKDKAKRATKKTNLQHS
ncbi:MAG: hypothetical protein KJ958_15265 [Gammaproteobacteria bacterium]|nr:hypothetical protein [Gammaproteobacteria bacterium]MBU1980516.1 hypothetical protein [Gammaproteobacteria bacterium]